MKKLLTWKLISESLENDIPVMLLYVLESSGSSPGRQGFLMTVNAEGAMEGSLGGGVMEYKFVEMSKVKLREQAYQNSVHKQIHNKTSSKHQSGMICSGEQTIFLYRLQNSDAVHIKSIIDCLNLYQYGLLQISPAGINFLPKILFERNIAFITQSEKDWVYKEQIGYKNHIYIIGGGHCALALSHIMNLMDFYIHLYDDRPELKTMIENDFVHEKEVLENYSMLSERIESGNNHYVVIMTFSYRTDAIALQAIINKRHKYLGLLGSKSKIQKMFADLRQQGIEESFLNKIYAPVGLPINSHTPEEVAISIAAEIIKIKNA